MKLPWDKSYFKLCFYIIFTYMVIYLYKSIIDIAFVALMNMGGIYRYIVHGIYTLISIFSVIIIGFTIAYILNPLVSFFENNKFKRGLSVLIVLLILSIVIGIVIFAVILNITNIFKYSLIEGINNQIHLFNTNLSKIRFILNKYNIKIFNNIDTFIFNNEFVYSISKYIMQLFLGLIIAIYFLIDKNKILDNIKEYRGIIPYKIRKYILYILNKLDIAFSGYIRGQLLDAIIISALYSLVLSIINTPFAIPIGLISGFLNIVPYFGALFGFIMAVGITVLSGNYAIALYSGFAIFLIQQIDSIYIVPKIVGDNTRISPVLVIISLAVFGNTFGIWGMVFAVPIVSFLKAILKDCVSKYKDI